MTMSGDRYEPLFDVHPVTGASIEVFYVDRTLETFGRCGAGWYWHLRRRGFAPSGPTHGPFPTTYAAYRNATTFSAPGAIIGLQLDRTSRLSHDPALFNK